MLACELATSIPAEKLFIPSFKLTEHFVAAICFSTSLENRGQYCGEGKQVSTLFFEKNSKKKASPENFMAKSAREISRLLKPLRKRLWSKWDLNGRMTVPV